jgi:PAS domain S-box-containing protein
MESFPLRVLVADGERIAGEVLVAALERTLLDVVGLASEATEAIELARRTRPDVALVDVGLPGGAVRATEGIVGGAEGCRVLALSETLETGAILQMLLAGAGGYVLRSAPSDELLENLRRVARADAGTPGEVGSGLIGDLLREIADLAQMQERLRRSEERFRGVLEAAPDAVVIVNAEGEIVLVNRQTEMMFGYARSELLGRPLEFLVPERFHLDHIRRRHEYLADPRTRRMGSVHGLAGRRMNAKEFPVDISLSTLESEEGPLVIAFVREISVRERIPETDEGHVARAEGERREPVIDLADAEQTDPVPDEVQVSDDVRQEV